MDKPKTYTVAHHAKVRYVERAVLENNLVDKDGKHIKVQQYTQIHENKILSDIDKLLSSCEFVYSGTVAEHQHSNFYVNKNGWCMIFNKQNDTLITLYKVDLNLNDEKFNTEFVNKSIERIVTAQKEYDDEYENIRLNKSKTQDEINILEIANKDLQAQIKANTETINYLKQSNNVIEAKLDLKRIDLRNVVTNLVNKDKVIFLAKKEN